MRAMEGDRLSGGIAPLIFKLGSRWVWVVRLSILATLLPEKKLDLEAGWALEPVWIFWRKNVSVAPAKIWTPDLPAYILVILLIMLSHTEWKIIQKFVLIEWNGGFWLDVFDSWLKFVEGFCGHCNFSWSSVKGNFF